MRRWLSSSALGALVASVASCGETPDPAALPASSVRPAAPPVDTVVLGVIDTEAAPGIPVLVGPAVLRAGVPADFVVHSLGSTTCTAPRHVDKRDAGAILELRPYDQVPVSPTLCSYDVAAQAHPVRVVLATPGMATIRIIGRRYDRALAQFRPETLEVRRRVLP